MYELKFYDEQWWIHYVIVATLQQARAEVAQCPNRLWTFDRLKVLSNGAIFDARYLDYLDIGVHSIGGVTNESVR